MALNTTVEQMKKMLCEITADLEKAVKGNRAAAQRVRTNTIKFAKTSKDYRKESIKEGRGKKATKRKTAAKKKVAKKAAPKRKATPKRKAVPKRKATAKKRVVKRAAPKRTTATRKKVAKRRARR